jgi:hypothetical protein
MDYAVYLTERALELRNRALTTRDAQACQALHHLADLCAAKAAILAAARTTPPAASSARPGCPEP